MSQDTSSNNKRIVKNTIYLYIRMLLIMAVTLYTSRVVLDTLGVTDFGIYNAVAGIVAMMGFLNNSMANAVQRFLSYEMGKKNDDRVNIIFNVSLQIHVVIAFIVLIVMEIAGVWFLNSKMNIPIDRMGAAMWVFQCSVVVTIFAILQVPYNAIILAKEQMNIYAYIGIAEVVLRLLIVYVLFIGHIDKLILYSILMMFVSVVVMMLYVIYCIRNYKESKLRIVKDKETIKSLAGFASWNMLGEIAWIFTGQGVNLLLNVFFGPVVNAARGVAYQVESAVMKFVSSFQVALNPQIIKTYAAEYHNQTIQLVYRGTRFSYYLLLLMAVPLFFEMDCILHLWLTEVPPLTVEFTQLVLVCSLVQTMSNLFATVAKAYGKIRNYQIIISIILFFNFPFSYLLLSLGFNPLSTVLVAITVQFVALVARLILTKRMINYSVREFFKQVMMPLMVISLLSIVAPILVTTFLKPSILRFFLTILISITYMSVIIYNWGMNKVEKELIKTQLVNVIKKISCTEKIQQP